MKPELKTCRARNGREWRQWLEKHHGSSSGIWLLFYKQPEQRNSLTYQQALDEALCFGWIDSIIKRIDDDCYVRKFTPRSNPRKWSPLNLKHMRRLINSGRVMEAGLRVLGVPLDPPAVSDSHEPPEEKLVPECMLAAIARNPKAEEFWRRLAPGCKRRYIGWVLDAKREETRQRRIDEVVAFLADGKKSVLK